MEETSWKFYNKFEFDANADKVLEYILQSNDHQTSRTVKLHDGMWACELYISACAAPKAIYSIGIIMNLSSGEELGWLDDKAIWLVHAKEVGEIGLQQERPNYCVAELLVDTNPYHWDFKGDKRSMYIGQRFLGLFWNELIVGWSSVGKDIIQNNSDDLHSLQGEPAGRPGDPLYDKAFESIQKGTSESDAFSEYRKKLQLLQPDMKYDKSLWRSFKVAMSRRRKKLSQNNDE